jgi:hypothetical protein
MVRIKNKKELHADISENIGSSLFYPDHPNILLFLLSASPHLYVDFAL